MNTRIHFILSASVSIGLASFAGISAFLLGVAAPATLLSFGLLAVYGMLEIAVLSYQSPRLVRLRPRAMATHTATIVNYPMEGASEVARAA
jgi:hypothetical protein